METDFSLDRILMDTYIDFTIMSYLYQKGLVKLEEYELEGMPNYVSVIRYGCVDYYYQLRANPENGKYLYQKMAQASIN